MDPNKTRAFYAKKITYKVAGPLKKATKRPIWISYQDYLGRWSSSSWFSSQGNLFMKRPNIKPLMSLGGHFGLFHSWLSHVLRQTEDAKESGIGLERPRKALARVMETSRAPHADTWLDLENWSLTAEICLLWQCYQKAHEVWAKIFMKSAKTAVLK